MTKTRWIGVLWASLAVLGHSLTAVGQSAAVPARPVTIGTLDSSGLKASGPRLFLTPAEIEQARRKIAADSRAKDVYDRLIVEADKALETKIEPLDESWWTQARDKPWEQTYPEVYENTSLKPLAIARPAGVLATAWLLTGQDRHADKAIALAMNLSSYSFEAEHYDVGMNYAGWGTEVLRVYDALWPRMSADQRRA
ncbi:MAG TPA: hypothetical protein VLM89_01125, partial [Phycisphaerae bacterium]|nr:hypothetical protein [Phycisphaerae bacterium]